MTTTNVAAKPKRWLKILLALLALITVAMAWVGFDIYRTFRQPTLPGHLQQQVITVAGQQRTFFYYVPAKPAQSPALVFALHGSNGDHTQIRIGSRYQFDLLAEQHGFIAVYPEGYKNFWNDCRKSADYAANTENIDDPAFFRAMIDYFARQHRADTSRVYALGVSNGGHMVYRLALETPELFAGFAAIAANLPVQENLDCQASGKPVSMAVLNGTRDPINPYDGGLVSILGNSSRGVVRSAAATLQYWNDLAGVSVPPQIERLPELDGNADTWIERSIWRAADGLEMRLYRLQGSGHLLPSRTSSVLDHALGGAAADLEAAPALWEFFANHRRELP